MKKSPLFKNSDRPLYQQIEKLIISWVEDGKLSPGGKLPSVREMSKKLNVSISTIIQSYSMLEAHGVIEARPQSGYYVKINLSSDQFQSSAHLIKSKPISRPRYIQKNSRILEIVRSWKCLD